MQGQIKKAIEIIKDGGVILYPTDTIWGLGCDPNNIHAINKLNKIKQRKTEKNYLLLVDNEHRIYNYVEEIPEISFELTKYKENPITIIYPNGKNVHQIVLAKDNSIGIRICEMKETKQLLIQLKHALISTSANISGENSPLNFQDISEQIKNQVDFILFPNKKIPKRNPSSIIKVETNGCFKIIRS